MTATVRLLGRAAVVRDDEEITARSRKSWALLALLALTRRPLSRRRVAAMLFDQADDPLGALRWTLAQLRRTLGPTAEVGGDPIILRLAGGTVLDVDVLTNGTWGEALRLPGLGEELLGDLDFDTNESFHAWLVVERAHTTTLAVGHLVEAALSQLAAGLPQEAADIAARLIELQPLDENHHQLLVRALASAGEARAARLHVAAATDLLTRELGIAPGSGLAAAAEVERGAITSTSGRGRARAVTQLEAGEAAIRAGATDAGLDCLRRAVEETSALPDVPLQINALTSLGGALIHAVRGRDTEGSATLHRAIRTAEEADLLDHTGAAHRELAWVAAQQGRHEQAHAWLNRATDIVGDDQAELARILGVRGLVLDDTGHHRAAIASLEESARLAEATGNRRQVAWALSGRGRTHLTLAEHGTAAELVEEALVLARSEGWHAFLPYPETQRAQLDLAGGRVGDAIDGFEHAFELACQVGDPCWEALAQRGLALTDAHDQRIGDAIARLQDARRRCARHPDTYRWVIAQVLDSMCELGVTYDLPLTSTWIEELERVAASSGLRELVVRAHLHSHHLGAPGALEAATILARDIDNPVLLAVGHAAPR